MSSPHHVYQKHTMGSNRIATVRPSLNDGVQLITQTPRIANENDMIRLAPSHLNDSLSESRTFSSVTGTLGNISTTSATVTQRASIITALDIISQDVGGIIMIGSGLLPLYALFIHVPSLSGWRHLPSIMIVHWSLSSIDQSRWSRKRSPHRLETIHKHAY